MLARDGIFLVNLTHPAIANLGNKQAVATIVDDDSQITIADTSVIEGNQGTADAVFTVTLSVPPTKTITVDYATSGTWGSGVGEETPVQRLLNGINLSSPGSPASAVVGTSGSVGERRGESTAIARTRSAFTCWAMPVMSWNMHWIRPPMRSCVPRSAPL